MVKHQSLAVGGRLLAASLKAKSAARSGWRPSIPTEKSSPLSGTVRLAKWLTNSTPDSDGFGAEAEFEPLVAESDLRAVALDPSVVGRRQGGGTYGKPEEGSEQQQSAVRSVHGESLSKSDLRQYVGGTLRVPQNLTQSVRATMAFPYAEREEYGGQTSRGT